MRTPISWVRCCTAVATTPPNPIAASNAADVAKIPNEKCAQPWLRQRSVHVVIESICRRELDTWRGFFYRATQRRHDRRLCEGRANDHCCRRKRKHRLRQCVVHTGDAWPRGNRRLGGSRGGVRALAIDHPAARPCRRAVHHHRPAQIRDRRHSRPQSYGPTCRPGKPPGRFVPRTTPRAHCHHDQFARIHFFVITRPHEPNDPPRAPATA